MYKPVVTEVAKLMHCETKTTPKISVNIQLFTKKHIARNKQHFRASEPICSELLRRTTKVVTLFFPSFLTSKVTLSPFTFRKF